MGGARLYFRLLGTALRARMEYRASFVLYAVGSLLVTALEFLAIWALFDRFGRLTDFTLPEVALLYAMANLSFGLAEMATRGFDTFSAIVRTGEFDRLLLRPRSTALQVAGRDIQPAKIGRLLQAAVVLAWALSALPIAWTLPKILLLPAAVLGGAGLFAGLFVLQATLSFVTIESLEVLNIFTYGGLESSQYPLAIYSKWFRRFFIFVVPMACLNYFPAMGLLGGIDPLGAPAFAPWISPLVGAAFLLACLRVWRFGERRYRSTGS